MNPLIILASAAALICGCSENCERALEEVCGDCPDFAERLQSIADDGELLDCGAAFRTTSYDVVVTSCDGWEPSSWYFRKESGHLVAVRVLMEIEGVFRCDEVWYGERIDVSDELVECQYFSDDPEVCM